MKHAPWCLSLLAGVLWGCALPPTGQASSTAAAARSISVQVRGPNDLARNGKIASELAASGTIGPGGVIANHGGNLIGVGGSMWRLAASSATLAPVAGARIELQTLAGTRIGMTLTSDAEGKVTLPEALDGELLTVVTVFVVDGAPYRLASLVAPGVPPAALAVDPIATMIEARARDLLGTRKTAAPVTFERLARVHAACDRAGVTVKPASLRADRALGEVTTDLNAVWKAEIDAKVTDPAENATIKGWVKDVRESTS